MNFSRTRKVVIRPAHRMPVRPHVIINAAMSVDGKIALSDGKAVRLSNEEDLRRVHRLRTEADAILVGVGTVLMDDPKLIVKTEYAKGRNPLRVVLDSKGKTPENAHVLDGTATTLIVTSEDSNRTFLRRLCPLPPFHGYRHRLSDAGSGPRPDRAGSIGRPDPPDTRQRAGGARLRRCPDSVR